MKVHTAGAPADRSVIASSQRYRTKHGAVVDLRISARGKLGLLQTRTNGLVQEDLRTRPSHGAGWMHFAVPANRRDGQRRASVSAALFFGLLMRVARLLGASRWTPLKAGTTPPAGPSAL